MMRMPAASKWVLCACLPWGLSVDDAHAQDADPPVAVADRHDTANAFLELLEEDERAAALRPFDHDSRHGWSFFPVKRDALRIGDLDAEERAALEAFLRVALSEAGRAKLADVLVVEAVLAEAARERRLEPREVLGLAGLHFFSACSEAT